MGCVTEVHLDGPTVLDVKIEADCVNTGSGFKDGKLKGKDFFDKEGSVYNILLYENIPNGA